MDINYKKQYIYNLSNNIKLQLKFSQINKYEVIMELGTMAPLLIFGMLL